MGRCFSTVKKLLGGCLLVAASQTGASTLQETIAYTIETNPEVLISMNRFRISEETVDIERAGYLPKLGVSGSLGWVRKHSRLEAGDSKTTDHQADAAFSIQQMLFDGFRTQNRIEGAQMDSRSRSLMMRSRADERCL